MSPLPSEADEISRLKGLAKESELVVTSVDEWRKPAQQGQPVRLPSGKVARVKRTMDLLELLRSGKIPNPLSSVVEKMISGGAKGEHPLDAKDMDPQAIVDMLAFIDQNVERAMIEPRCELPPPPKENETADDYRARLDEWEPSEGAVAIYEIDLDDRMFIFTFAQGLAGELESFRKAQDAAMASLPNVPQAAVQTQPAS